jgi:dienelactone hydrolase
MEHAMTIRLVALVTTLLAACAIARADPLAGTQPLTMQGDIASQMVDGIDKFLLRETDAAVARRDASWKEPGDLTARRRRLAKIIGATDAREPLDKMLLTGTVGDQSAPLAFSDNVGVFAVNWPALGHGVNVEGLYLRPIREITAGYVVAVPDADHTPEAIAGLLPGLPKEEQFALRLAQSGCAVLVPALIDRSDTFSVSRADQATNQPHREWVYRPAFEMGRHVIGYEVQKVLTCVDFMARRSADTGKKIGVMGYGEGGLIALHAAALDKRIAAACVSGYFDTRQDVWREPIYRNLFGLLNEFGDAELARLIGPRKLIVEACKGPELSGPPAPREGRRGAAPGRLVSSPLDSVKREIARIGPAASVELVVSDGGTGSFGTEPALGALLKALGAEGRVADYGPAPKVEFGTDHLAASVTPRLRRQINAMTEYTQSVVRESEYTRRKFWAKADPARAARSPEQWKEATEHYRKVFYDEIIGRFDRPLLPPNVRSRQVYDEPKFTGYEVVMDVFPDVFAYGILLVPKGIKPDEKRPVVVCQHGLEGRPQDAADPKVDSPYYHRFACQLAEQGFVTYAPQNPYIFGDRFRSLQRKANPLGKTLFSIIVPQHQQTTDWLATLPFVDPDRIAFYGLSYGGKTAMRVPPLVTRYCLSICSADFNEWIWKNTSVRSPYSYVPNIEYEIFEWDLGNTFNYAEMAGLICPRPFMVERGHHDGVAPDEWVAYEYAKARSLYTDLKIPDRTRIEFFDGPHTIHGVGTFEFLHEQLKWPPR